MGDTHIHVHLSGEAEVTPRSKIVKRKAAPKKASAPPKRKASAYSKRYGAAFRKVSDRHKKKSGGWKQGGFKRAQKAAHKIAKGKK